MSIKFQIIPRCVCIILIIIALFAVIYFYITDTRYYLFQYYTGKISADTKIGRLYASPDDTKWINISNDIPRLTEVIPTGFGVALETQQRPDRVIASVRISLAKTGKIIFEDSGMLEFKSNSGNYGSVVFKNMDFINQDIIADVTVKAIINENETTETHTFYFKPVREFEQHLETIYQMMGI